VFGLVQALFAFQLGQTSGALRPAPDADLVRDFYGFAHVLDSGFKDAVAAGALDAVRGEVARLSPEGAVLHDGRTIPADVIVCGTGFKKAYDYLPQPERAALRVASDG
jgi:dimethylaniline monooxygenase (N-oxide forming)